MGKKKRKKWELDWPVGAVKRDIGLRSLTLLDVRNLSDERGSPTLGVCTDRCSFRIYRDPEAFVWFGGLKASERTCPRCGNPMVMQSLRTWDGVFFLFEAPAQQERKAKHEIHYRVRIKGVKRFYTLTACRRDLSNRSLTDNKEEVTCSHCLERILSRT